MTVDPEMDLEIVPFEPQTATRDQWNRFHVFRRVRHVEVDPEDPQWEDASVEGWMKKDDPQMDEVRFAVLDPAENGAMVAMLTVAVTRETAPSHEEKKDEANVEVEVLKPHRHRGIGRRLLHKALGVAEEHSRSLLVGHAEEEDGIAMMKALGAHFARTSRQSRLRLGEIDWELVEGWVKEGPERSPDTSLRWFGNRMDEAYLEPYAKLFTEVFNDAPRGELETGDLIFTPAVLREWEARFDATGGQAILAVSQEPDGALSGMTEMGYWSDQVWMIHQFMTGVRRRYRGRGLGKWLKAAMLLRVREVLPEVRVVVTNNATTNAAMLSINERLGFKPHKEWESAQIRAEELRRRLGQGPSSGSQE